MDLHSLVAGFNLSVRIVEEQEGSARERHLPSLPSRDALYRRFLAQRRGAILQL